MKVYWVEAAASGQVLSCGSYPESFTPTPMRGGSMHVVDRQYLPNEVAFFDGVIVPIGTAPSPAHVFDFAAREWADLRTLDDLKAAKWDEIKAARNVTEFATFTYGGMVFDGDVDSQRRLNGYISIAKSALAAEQPFTADFTLHNNEVVLLTAEDFIGIELAKVQDVAAAFGKAVHLRGLIEAAVSVDELQSIEW